MRQGQSCRTMPIGTARSHGCSPPAGGPLLSFLSGLSGDGPPPRTILRSRGVHMIVERSAIQSDVGMTLRVPGRVVFVIPWQGQWLVGREQGGFNDSSD